ncbi:hypothetical protein [Aeoliella sp. SH292]|uniref:hypothetical protein n=1 Tax=Aeoliella sp. SH292 TaxID=3454464 RepID=UPI003F99DB1A
MQFDEQIQLERLVCRLVDEGATQEVAEGLNALLVDRPDLQEHYTHYYTLHLLLARELSHSYGHFPSLLVPQAEVNLTGSAEGGCSVLLQRINSDLKTGESNPWRRGWMQTLLAALAVGLLGVILFRTPEASSSDSVSAIGTDDSEGYIFHQDIHNALFWSDDVHTTTLVGQLSQTSVPSRLMLPTLADLRQGIPQLASGTAWMEFAAGNRERGRVVELPPGQSMEVFIVSDASSENKLNVVELDSKGRAVGAHCSFGNVISRGENATVGTGWIGRFSQSNTSDRSKYYLFVGAYHAGSSTEGQPWLTSDFEVYIESNELLIVGWDDHSYYNSNEPAESMSLTVDGDYNDIRAIVRFSRLGGKRVVTNPAEYLPAPPKVKMPAANMHVGYRLHVKPGQEAYIMASSYAWLRNAVQIVDVQTGQVLWRNEGNDCVRCANGRIPADRGVYVIRNESDLVKEYELQGSVLEEDSEGKWRTTPHNILEETSDAILIGFEDSHHYSTLTDWQDISVAIYSFRTAE